MPLLADFIAAVDQVIGDGETYHAIVHGPATGDDSTVETDNGPVKTFAKLEADLSAVSLSSVLGLLNVPMYTNLAIANAALPIGSPYYDTTLFKLQITTA